jgi:hypothetical protein
VLAVLLACGACGSAASAGPSSGKPQDEESAIRAVLGLTVPATPDPGVRAEIAGLGANEAYLAHAQSVLIDRCMRVQGFSYPIETQPAAKQDNEYGLSMADAEKSGYTTESNMLTVPDITSDNLGPTDPAENERYEAALDGAPNAPRVSFPTAFMGGGSESTSSEGCIAEAAKQVFGTMQAAVEQATYEGSFGMQSLAQADADPAIAALNRQWSACMTAAGQPPYDSPAGALNQARKLANMQLDRAVKDT